MTIVQQVEIWYSERQEQLSKLFLKMKFSSKDPESPDGEVGLGLEGPKVIANISIWNSGLIRIPALTKASGVDFILDDKVLAPDEDLAALLDHYVKEIASEE
jgi:hypothetical protein